MLSTVPVVSMTFNVVTDTKATTSAFVVDLYADVLFRNAGPRAMRSLEKQLMSGRMTAGGAFASLVASPEFAAKVAPVLSMYEGYLGRPADAQGLRSWIGRERGAARWRRSPRALRDHPSSSPQTATCWQKAIAALSASFTRNCSTAPQTRAA